MPRAVLSKNFQFTINSKGTSYSYSKSPDEILEECKSSLDVKVLFICFQEEKGDNTGRPHFQGFISIEQAFTIRQFKPWWKRLGLGHVHLEPCRGDYESNLRYVTKEDTRVDGPWQYGTPIHFGRDSQVDSTYGHNKRQKTTYPRRETFGRTVILCCGPPKIGKTRIWRTILEYIHPDVYYVPARAKQSNARWIGPYAGEHTAIIDEFKYGDFAEDQWKCILDGLDHVMPCAMGGKSIMWQPEVVVILTNQPFDYLLTKFLSNPALSARIDDVFDWTHVIPSPLYVKTPRIHAFPS